MKSLFNCIILVGLLTSCGMDVDVKGVPEDTEHKVLMDDGYIALHEFCDEKYGELTEESNQCIEDGLGYKNLGLELGIDDTLTQFCESKDDIQGCIEDIGEFIDSIKNKGKGKL